METEVTDIQTTYTAEHPSFTVVNTTDRSHSFIPPELVEIFSNTHRPAEQSDKNTVKPIPTPSDNPTTQLQSTTDTDIKADYNHCITEKHFIFLPNTTDNDRQSTDKQLPIIKHLPTNSLPTEQPNPKSDEHIPPPPISQKNHLQSNVTNPDIETEYNLSVNKLQYIYLPSTTDDELSKFQHLPTDDKTTEQIPTLSNTNRPLLYPSRPANQLPRKSNAFPPEIIYTLPEITSRNPIINPPADIIYISLYTEADKSPD